MWTSSTQGLWPRGGEMPVFLPVELASADSTSGDRDTAMAPLAGEVAIVLANGRQLRCRADLPEAELAMLWEGIDWRRPDWGAPPARVG